MPELPEVEVTRRGVAPYLEGRMVSAVVFYREGLRWPFPQNLPGLLCGRIVRSVGRRGKYLLVCFDHGTLLIHLGMSGHLRIQDCGTDRQKHDHFDLEVGQQLLRLTDPRRFGSVLWHDHAQGAVEQHVLLTKLGAEPLEKVFSAQLLYQKTRQRKSAIKQVLLAGDIVVGVGNIYACESLFHAGIHPKTRADRIGLVRYQQLVDAIRTVLTAAIDKGGSSLRDFIGADGESGYFQQSYFVYDRAGLLCKRCNTVIAQVKQGQRTTFYCKRCQS